MLRAQCGDRDALELVLRTIQTPLRRYLAGLVGPGDADDILQDVLLLISRKLYWLEQPELLRAWAFRIASRAAFRHLKKRRRWPDATVDESALDEIADTNTYRALANKGYEAEQADRDQRVAELKSRRKTRT